MTTYVGENINITHAATADSELLEPGDVTAVKVTVYDPDGDIVVAETNMTWDVLKSRWYYLWDTSTGSLSHGTYRAKVRIEGIDGGSVWEYKRIRLARNPV